MALRNRRRAILGTIRIYALPTHLRVASRRMGEIIRGSEFDALFLDLSQHLNDSIRALAEGASYEYFLERVREQALVPEPLGSWEYEAEPILLSIRGILNKKHGLEIWCHKQPDFIQLSAKVAENIAMLVLRASVTERIIAEDWRDQIKRFLEANAETRKEEAEYVAERTDARETSVCVSDINARTLQDQMLGFGLNTELTYVFLPYHFTPIEILTHMIDRENRGSIANEKRILQIIKCHIDFVREYILASRNYDEAYFKWVGEKAPWLKIQSLTLNALTN